MNATSPDSAPPRDDLPWLRRRTTRTNRSVDPADLDVRDDTFNEGAALSSRATGLAAAGTPRQFDVPQRGRELDLSEDSHSHTTTTAQASGPDRMLPSSSALDLHLEVPPPAAMQAGANSTSHRSEDEDPLRATRTNNGLPTILTTQRPVVTLTRMQSGVGALTFQAVCSESVGDLRLDCAYQFASGQSSVTRQASSMRVAPAGSRRPVIIASGERFDTLTIDLAQSREVERLIVYAYSASGAVLNWDGTLVVLTYGGARVEVPMRRDPAAGVLVLLSLYNIAGEFVLRAEQAIFRGSIREATAAFGFERISWLDDHTPLN